MRYFGQLIALTCGKLRRQTVLLAGLAALCVGLPVLAGAAGEAALSGGVDFNGIILAVTAPDGDKLPGQLERYMGGMEDIRRYCQITAMPRNEALAALKNGEVTAVLDLPADFARRVQRGENPAVQVIADGDRPLESLLTLWVGQSAADLLAAAQAGIYAVLDLYDAAPPESLTRDRAVMDINLKFVQWTLTRQEHFIQEEILPTGALPIAQHYRLSLLAYLMLAAAPVFAWCWQEPWVEVPRRMRYAKRSPLWGFFAGGAVCWTVMAAVVFAAFRILMESSVGKNLAAAAVWSLFFTAYASFCASASRTSAGCGGVSFLLSLAALAVSGGIVPPVLLPEAVRRWEAFSPVTWLRAAAVGRSAVVLLLASGTLCAVSAWLFARRVERREAV